MKKLSTIIILVLFCMNTYAAQINLPDGSIYSGEINNGLFNGYGELQLSEDDVYKGYFKDGKYHGEGILNTLNYSYEGNFENGLMTGNGSLQYKDGLSYIGGFANNPMSLT